MWRNTYFSGSKWLDLEWYQNFYRWLNKIPFSQVVFQNPIFKKWNPNVKCIENLKIPNPRLLTPPMHITSTLIYPLETNFCCKVCKLLTFWRDRIHNRGRWGYREFWRREGGTSNCGLCCQGDPGVHYTRSVTLLAGAQHSLTGRPQSSQFRQWPVIPLGHTLLGI